VGVHDSALARQILLEALPRWPDTYFTMDAHSIVGVTYMQQDQFKSAIAYYERTVKEHPTSNWDSMLLTVIGRLNERIGDKAGAIDAYQRCIRFDPNTDWAETSRKALAFLKTPGK